MKKVYFFLSLFFVLLVSCSNIFEKTQYGSLIMTLPGQSSTARIAGYTAQNDTTRYEIRFTSGSYDKTISANPGDLVYLDSLPEGEYKIYGIAYNSSDVVVASGYVYVTVESGMTKTIPLKLGATVPMLLWTYLDDGSISLYKSDTLQKGNGATLITSGISGSIVGTFDLEETPYLATRYGTLKNCSTNISSSLDVYDVYAVNNNVYALILDSGSITDIRLLFSNGESIGTPTSVFTTVPTQINDYTLIAVSEDEQYFYGVYKSGSSSIYIQRVDNNGVVLDKTFSIPGNVSNYSTISDMCVIGDSVYVLFCNNTNFTFEAENSNYQSGAVVKLNASTLVIDTTFGNNGCAGFSAEQHTEKVIRISNDEEEEITAYYPSDISKNFLGPRAIIALSPKRLYIADVGGTIENKHSSKRNRIVTFDLESASFADVTETDYNFGITSIGTYY